MTAQPIRRYLAGVMFCIALLAGGCATPSPGQRIGAANALATDAHWRAVALKGHTFTLAGFVPSASTQADVVTVYFEGDGLAWDSPDTPSDDPTPVHPIGLALALAQPRGASAYVARPCQFRAQMEPACVSRYWTSARYAPEVIDDMNHAVDLLKARTGATHVALVGYSGGGALAALVAARRHDITLLVTVAGNIDVDSWTRIERLRPLHESLDPANFVAQLQHVRQVHFVGSDDMVVPPSVAREFVEHFPTAAAPPIVEMQGFDHTCCWVQHWPAMISPWLPIDGQPVGTPTSQDS